VYYQAERLQMDEGNDPELIRSALAGDPRAFDALYTRHARRVAGLCRRLLGPCPEVEEAVNEVFLKMSCSLATLDARRPVAPWLLATASHHCLNLLRRRGLERAHFAEAPPEVDGAAATAEPAPLARLEGREQVARLERAMDALADRHRVVLVLRYQRELSYQQIADELGVTQQNVAVLLHRAKKSLRGAMGDAGGAEQEDEP
jgi:RNA polymerase sigma-70 factor (ECF subfamily)